MGYVIKMLVSVFGPRDFALTAPVCEHIDDHAVMARELALDMAHGLVGKTAIHPGQIEVIQNALMVTQGEYSDALRILNSTRPCLSRREQCVNPPHIAAGRLAFWTELVFMGYRTSKALMESDYLP